MRAPAKRSCSLSLLALLLTCGAVRAETWPGWRGPGQNGVSGETGLVSSWSAEGENLIWKADFVGRSTPVVFDGRACVIGRVGEGVTRQERIACFDAGDGDLLWERRLNVYHTTHPFTRVGWASLVGDPETGNVYAQGAGGLFVCLDREGAIVWSRNLAEEFGRFSGYGGRTQTPIVDGDLVINHFVSAGWGDQGIPRHRYFAFDKRTGEVIWVSTPGGAIANTTPYSTPVVTEIGGRRMLIGGNADGAIYAVSVETGEVVWKFHLSKRGLHTSVVVDGTRVYASHGEENVDEGVMGRVVCIDGAGTGDVTRTREVWRVNELKAGYASPTFHDGVLYVVDDSANLHAIRGSDGKALWTHNLGTVGKGSPVWADGKLYVTEVNGNFHILRPGPDGVRPLDRESLTVADGRYAEIYGSPAVAYGRIYFATEGGLYCLGDPDRPFRLPPPAPAAPGPDRSRRASVAPEVIRVVPAEVIVDSNEPVRFRIRAFDDRGRFLGETDGAWSLEGLDGSIAPDGTLTADRSAASRAGRVVARVGTMKAEARVRVFGDLPWEENFESLEPGSRMSGWIAAGNKFVVEKLGDGRVLAKPPAARGVQRTRVFLGPSSLAGYTVQADVRGARSGRRRGDVGIIASGYTMDLMGNHQRLQIRSWLSELRMAEHVAYSWVPDVWYTMKLQVDYEDDRAVVRGKVWPAGGDEPGTWTLTVEDPLPIRGGAPGIIGHSLVDVYWDNIKVWRHRAEARRPAAAPRGDATALDAAMFGGTPSRNMVSDETGLPETWDPKSGANVKWTATLGSQTYAGPVVYRGKVYVGTNNEGRRNPRLDGDRGVVMAFRADDGELLWQAAHPKLPAGLVNDWPLQGVCSTPHVEGDRLYYVSNRAEVICADTEGFRDGENDGPYLDEAHKSEIDEDIVWKLDMIGELDVFPHNLAAGSPLVVGDILYTVTGNGVDEGHLNVPSPFAPSFIAVDKNTGKVVWEDASPGENILHGSWSNPAYGVVQGRPQVLMPGGDGWLYAFEPRTGELLWKFDLNPKDSVWRLGGAGTRNNVISTPVVYDDKVYIAVGQDPEHGEGVGNLWAIDASMDGDVTDRAAVWRRSGEDFRRTISTVAIKDDLLFAADLSGFLYCLDAQSGKHHWTYDTFAAVWGSPFVADGKVYLGDEDGDIVVLRASEKMEVLHEVNLGSAVYTTPVAKDGVLYIASRTTLFAIAKGAKSKPAGVRP